jgi:hypothetical protein
MVDLTGIVPLTRLAGDFDGGCFNAALGAEGLLYFLVNAFKICSC